MDLIQNYLTPFLVKHLEQYLDKPNLIFEKRKDEEARINNMEFELGQIKAKLNYLLGFGWEHSSNTEITMEEIRLMKSQLQDAMWRLTELEVLMNK